jgi:hypothetical protein
MDAGGDFPTCIICSTCSGGNTVMQKKMFSFISVLMILAMMFVAMPVSQAQAASQVVYDSLLSPLPANVASVGFQATSTSEFGDYIHLSSGSNRLLQTITVTMSDWAKHSEYPSLPDVGFDHPITVNIYSVVKGSPNTVGSLIASKTQTFTIPWRPEADPTCATPSKWRALDGICYNGFAFNITFDLSSLLVTLPDDVIVAFAYNTNTYGYAPLNANGPYESLNVGVEGAAVVGSDDSTDKVFQNSTWSGAYTDGVVGTFSEDSAWAPYGTLPMQITAIPAVADTVYVDASWASLAAGVDPDGSGPALGIGFDAFATIQAGIDAVADGGTVNVNAGTYVESIHIVGKTITLQGQTGAVIQSPVTIPAASTFTTSVANKAVVYLNNTNSIVDGFVIDGASHGNGNYRFVGVAFFNSGGTLKNSIVKNVQENPFNGNQHGNAVYAYNTDGVAREVTVANNQVFDFQKNGITVNGANLTGHINQNTVTCKGTINITAENGIQIGFGAAATLQGNTVSGCSFHLTGNTSDWGSAGVLLYQPGNVSFQGGNNIFNNDSNVYIYSDNTTTFGAEMVGPSTAPIDTGYDIVNYSENDIDVSQVTFTGTSNDFEIARMVWDKIDDSSLGYADWGQTNHVYVYDVDSLNAALLNAPAGSIIHLKNGVTFSQSGGFEITRPHLTILLEDGTVVQNSSPCFDVNASYTTITTESTSGAKCVPTNGANGINVASGLQNIIIQGLDIDGTGQSTGDGINFAGAITDVQVLDNYVHALGGNALSFAATPVGVVDIQGNLFKANTGFGVSAPADVNVSYNSWGDYAGPAGTNGDGVAPAITSFSPWTYGSSSMQYSGSPWPNQVLPGYNITYTVYADLQSVEGANVSVTLPAGMTYVGTNCLANQCSGTFDVESVTKTGNLLTFVGANSTSPAVSGQAKALFTYTMTGVSGSNLLAFDAANTAFAMAPAAGPTNNIYTAQLSDGAVNVISALPTLNTTGLAVPFTVGHAQEFSLVINNPLAGVAYAHPQVRISLPAGATLEYYNGSTWATVTGGSIDLAALAASGTDVTVPLRVTFASPASVAFSASLYDTVEVTPDALLATTSTSIDVRATASLTGTFSMQGRTTRAGVPVTLTGTLFGALSGLSIDQISNNLVITGVISYDTYTLTTNQPRYLNVTADLAKTVAGNKGTMNALELKGGNAVWTNNVIDVYDASRVGTDWGVTGDGDVNFSGKVDIFDLAIVGGNYNLTSATAYGTWVP